MIPFIIERIMQDVQEHSSVSKINNGAAQHKLHSLKLRGKDLFEMFYEIYFSQLRDGIKLPLQDFFLHY